MTREELLAKLQNFSNEELNAILEKTVAASKDLIPHEDLNEEFSIIYYNGKKSYIVQTWKDFESKLRNLLTKTSYGVNTYIGYNKFQRTLSYGHTADEIVAFIKEIFADITRDASFGAARNIELFNSKNEILWSVFYKNEIVRNLEDFYDKTLGMNSEFAELLEKAKETGANEETIDEISKGLLYISDLLYFKDGFDKNAWESMPTEKAKERDELFENLKNKRLTYIIDEKANDPLTVLFNILFKSYKY